MSALSDTNATKSRKLEKAGPGNKPRGRNSPRRKTDAPKPADKGKPALAYDDPRASRATKNDRMLSLLNRPHGASLEELMQVTDWQIHSVRGFLAGGVKKRPGFTLTSLLSEGEVRHYRIEPHRGQ